MRSVFEPPIDEATDSSVRSALVEQKLRSIVSGYTIAVTSDPVSGVLDMMVLSRLLARSWAPGTAAFESFGTFGPQVSRGVNVAESKIWKTGGALLSASERKQLEDRIDRWIAESPDIKSVSFARLSDIDAGFDARLEAEVAKSQGLMEVLDEAMQSAEELRMLGERSLWLASRAPILVRMTAEASVVTAFDTPQVQDVLNSSRALPVAVDQLASQIRDAAANIDRQRHEITASFESAHDSIQPVLRQVGEIVDRVDGVIREARKLSSERSEAAEAAATASKNLQEALATLNSMAERYFPPEAGGAPDIRSRPTADLALAAERFNSAVLNLQTLISSNDAGQSIADLSRMADAKVAAISESTNGVIDRAFWKGVILLILAFTLACAYKVIAPRLAPR
ncbi:MAG: hypothetical protein KF691_08700 [Phycisphaeraceae bacterium]|nr:hypothetical protein [Phycisphaeraceae bacterium]